MTIAAKTPPYISPTQYLAAERQALTKSEYFGGVVVAMSGATWHHNLITANILHLLSGQLTESPCSVVSSDQRVRVPECNRYYYPDVVMVCGEPELEDSMLDSLLNPKIIVEVLSNSTERLDREEKYDCYRTLPSLSDYILVSQIRPRIEHFSRQADGRWMHSVVIDPAGALVIPSVDCKLSLEQVYARVRFADVSASARYEPGTVNIQQLPLPQGEVR